MSKWLKKTSLNIEKAWMGRPHGFHH
jgi:hypothetical protein